MKITVRRDEFNRQETLIVGFDVGKDRINGLSRVQDNGSEVTLEEEVENRAVPVRECLGRYVEQASRLGLSSVHVVCEPTGGYERKLLVAAREMGLTTEYVSGLAVHRSQPVESNDTGKSDVKDPGTIHTLANLGRTLKVRFLEGEYAALRRLNEIYEDEDKAVVQARTRVHAVITELFVDWPMDAKWLFNNAGRALIETYGCNPYHIAEDGREKFMRRLRKAAGRAFRRKTAEKIWKAALSSCLHVLDPIHRQVLTDRLRDLRSDWERHVQRKEAIKEKMVALYEQTPEAELFRTLPENISVYLLARLVAETGPMADFDDIRQLWRYAGLNLRERTSGKYVGQLKISKKGRSLLRKVLYQITFSHLIVKGGLYSTWYRQRKERKDNKGRKVMVGVMRHFLKCLHAMVRHKEAFSPQRLFLQTGQTGEQAA